MKTPIYVLHGWSYDTSKWQPIADKLKAAGIEVRLLNVPGLTTADLPRSWTIDDYVKWLHKETSDQPAVLIGHSNGGRIALNYATRYPEKVEQLILIDAAGIPAGPSVKRSAFKLAAKTGKVFTKSPKARKLLHKLARVNDYHDASPVMRQTMSNLLASDRQLDVRRVQAPTTLIWGREDTMTPLKQGQTMQQRIKGSSLTIVDGARHAPQFTHTDQVVEIITKALK